MPGGREVARPRHHASPSSRMVDRNFARRSLGRAMPCSRTDDRHDPTTQLIPCPKASNPRCLALTPSTNRRTPWHGIAWGRRVTHQLQLSAPLAACIYTFAHPPLESWPSRGMRGKGLGRGPRTEQNSKPSFRG